jgi:hypothetical protein
METAGTHSRRGGLICEARRQWRGGRERGRNANRLREAVGTEVAHRARVVSVLPNVPGLSPVGTEAGDRPRWPTLRGYAEGGGRSAPRRGMHRVKARTWCTKAENDTVRIDATGRSANATAISYEMTKMADWLFHDACVRTATHGLRISLGRLRAISVVAGSQMGP